MFNVAVTVAAVTVFNVAVTFATFLCCCCCFNVVTVAAVVCNIPQFR